MAVIKRQQGIGAQTLWKRQNTQDFQPHLQRLDYSGKLMQKGKNDQVKLCFSELADWRKEKEQTGTFVMYWTKSLRKGSLQRMNHMAITWWASDTIYWLNLDG